MAHQHTLSAVFLDRDGVLNPNVFYHDTQVWEAPREAREFRLADGVLPALAKLQAAGFLLCVVSNQPNAAKGKSTAGALDEMHGMLLSWLQGAKIQLAGAFYCRHHPDITGTCLCRKPSPYFLLQARAVFGLSLQHCWMVGDRTTDMECGRAAGTRTAWIETEQERDLPEGSLVDIRSNDLTSAVEQILALSLQD